MSTNTKGWIGVDLDGTLAKYDSWRGLHHIGEPIQPMVQRVQEWLRAGYQVKIVTARIKGPIAADRRIFKELLTAWCKQHIGQDLDVTSSKDMRMIELWDDRAVQVIPNTGMPVMGFKSRCLPTFTG